MSVEILLIVLGYVIATAGVLLLIARHGRRKRRAAWRAYYGSRDDRPRR